MLKLIVIGIGGLIAFEGFKAYGALGYEWNGMLGKVLAILIFCVIQQGELRPVIMSRGQMGPLQTLALSFGGKPINLQLVDPEELHDASKWAFRCYCADMVVGLFVWVPVRFALIQAGAVTPSDISLPNLGMIIAVTFVLQECVAYYLRNGGRVPSMPFSGKAKSNAN
jgi:hypothetical protein